MTRTSTQHATRRTLAALVAAVVLAAPGMAHADTAKEQELEARVADLEKLVRQLLAEKQAAAPAAAPVTQVAAAPAKAGPPPIQDTTITPNALAGTKFTFTGFLKLDALYSKYTDGEVADGSVGRDFYLPSSIPVGGVDEQADFDAHIKQSRFIFATDTATKDGHKLSTKLEFDLYGSTLGDERATNTYGLQVRHAFLTYDDWLFGQTWSNFQDAAVLPESVDFIGPTDGTIFVRQPQVRFTRGGFSASLENPETTLTPYGGGTRISSDDNDLPDLTAAYSFKFARGYVRLAGLARQLKYENGSFNDDEYSLAGSLSGKIMLGKDDIRFMLTAGDGIGRYIGVNFTNDAVIDTPDGRLESISGWAGFAAWRHVFTDRFRTNLAISSSEYDNDITLTGGAASKSTFTWSLNALYSPVPKLDLGVEYRQATREVESGAEGDLRRLQATAKYSF